MGATTDSRSVAFNEIARQPKDIWSQLKEFKGKHESATLDRQKFEVSILGDSNSDCAVVLVYNHWIVSCIESRGIHDRSSAASLRSGENPPHVS